MLKLLNMDVDWPAFAEFCKIKPIKLFSKNLVKKKHYEINKQFFTSVLNTYDISFKYQEILT